jgi:hypothetical protein
VLDVDDCAVQAEARGRSGLVELGVVGGRGDDVLHRFAGQGAGNQRANQETRDGGVAVRKVEDLGFFLFARVEAQAIETRVGEGLIVVARNVATYCGNRLDSHAEQIVRERLKNG